MFSLDYEIQVHSFLKTLIWKQDALQKKLLDFASKTDEIESYLR